MIGVNFDQFLRRGSFFISKNVISKVVLYFVNIDQNRIK